MLAHAIRALPRDGRFLSRCIVTGDTLPLAVCTCSGRSAPPVQQDVIGAGSVPQIGGEGGERDNDEAVHAGDDPAMAKDRLQRQCRSWVQH